MKNVLYVGNALSKTGRTVTTIETLGAHLKELCRIKIASQKANKFLRLLDMMQLVIKNRSQTDLVLIDTYSTLNFYYAYIISKLCIAFKIDYIPILHGGNLEKRLVESRKMGMGIFNNAKCLVAPSNFLKSKFETHGYNNVVYIPNCIAIENYNFQNRKIETIKMLWVRSFSSIYNPKLAVLILEGLILKGYDATLTMVGPDVDGSLSEVRKLAKDKNLNVNFTGKLSKQEWIALSKNHNVFLNTTNYDNMPVSVIEAMALGLPIVSTNVGGLPYLISNEEEGVLVEPNAVEAMVKAILRIKKDKVLRYNMVENARLKAESFDWNAIKPKWNAVLND